MAYDNWTFSLVFEVPAELLDCPSVLLELGGLDTGDEVVEGAAPRPP